MRAEFCPRLGLCISEVEEGDFAQGYMVWHLIFLSETPKRTFKYVCSFLEQIVTGRWLVDGNPQVILFDIGSTA